MLKTYQKYIFQNFLSKFILTTLVFFSLTIILGVLEEISFTKNLNTSFFSPYFLTLLNKAKFSPPIPLNSGGPG